MCTKPFVIGFLLIGLFVLMFFAGVDYGSNKCLHNIHQVENGKQI